MEAVKQWWKTSKGHKLFAWHLLPVSTPKAIILMVHGHGEYSWRFFQWAKQFTYNGYAFFAWDHLGHGASDGQQGHIRHYEQLLFEIDLAITKVKEQLPGIPIILYGHSMGGNIAINYAIRRTSPVKLLIATSPWLELTNPAPPFLNFMSKVLNVIFPFYPFTSTVKASQISHVEEEIKKYESDPLIHNKITPRLYISILNAGKFALAKASRIKIPTLLMHGDADSITSPKATATIAKVIPNCTYVEWPGLYHELHNETQKDAVFNRILDWIESQLKQNAI